MRGGLVSSCTYPYIKACMHDTYVRMYVRRYVSFMHVCMYVCAHVCRYHVDEPAPQGETLGTAKKRLKVKKSSKDHPILG